MNTLTDRSNLDHLRKQAKDLLRQYRASDEAALARLRQFLPVARGKSDAALLALELRLHDMQSCLAREHGFGSWNALKDELDMRRARAQNILALRRHWLGLVYGGDLAGGSVRQRPEAAARVLAANPDLLGDDAHLACAVGDVGSVSRALDANPGWVKAAGGLLNVHPIIAVAHSSLVKLPAFRDGLLACLRLLLSPWGGPQPVVFQSQATAFAGKPR